MAQPIKLNLEEDRLRYAESSPSSGMLTGNSASTVALPQSDDVVDDAAERMRRLAEDVRGRFEVAADQARRKMNEVTERASELAEEAGERFNGIKRDINNRIPIWKNEARQRALAAQRLARQSAREVDARVKANPRESVMIAAGVGFAVGMAMRVWRSNRG